MSAHDPFKDDPQLADFDQRVGEIKSLKLTRLDHHQALLWRNALTAIRDGLVVGDEDNCAHRMKRLVVLVLDEAVGVQQTSRGHAFSGSCPRCGSQLDRDEVDVGVGFVSGPFGCSTCHWCEDPSADVDIF